MSLILLSVFASQSSLLTGVSTIPTPGSPGLVVPLSQSAKTIFVGMQSKLPRPVAVQTTLGKGKIVAFAHTSYLSPETVATGDMRTFMKNCFAWMGSKKVAVLDRQIADSWIRDLGFEPTNLSAQFSAADLRSLDTVILYETSQVDLLRKFVEKGGKLLVANTPWGWMSLNPGKNLSTDLPINRLMVAAGAVFTDGSVSAVRPAGESEQAAFSAADALDRITANKPSAVDADTVMECLRSLPPSNPLWTKTRALVEGVAAIPTSKTPIKAENAAARLTVLFRHLDPTFGLGVDPSAIYFPGFVPLEAKRIDTTVSIRTDVRHWASTGTYANAGEEIELDVPNELVGKGLNLQIGVHTDTLWNLPKWERDPAVVVRAPIKSNKTKLRSPFGGLVIVDVTKPFGSVDAEVTVKGVVASSRYVLGKTTDWKSEREKPAPWAEFESKHLILSVPIEDARRVEDPEKLMKLWDRTLELFDDLDGNGNKPRPERIVCDRQISAGYMHSGYPIMTWMDKSIALSLDAEKLVTDGTWGHWHELGHNRQKPEWTFGGTGEVTNNLFTLWGMVKVAGKPVKDRLKQNEKEVAKYFADGANFDEWKAKPFVALTMYAELIEGFGWESLQKTFRSYRTGPLPKSDQDKRDQWMVRYSKIVGKNLGPFFDRWGVPVTEAAKKEVATLPAWSGKG